MKNSLHKKNISEVFSMQMSLTVVVLSPSVLGEGDQHHLEHEQGVGVGPVVVGAERGDDTRLGPGKAGLCGDSSESTKDLRSNHARGTEHGPSAIDDLSVREPLGVNEVASTLGIGEAKGIEAEIAGQAATVNVTIEQPHSINKTRRIHLFRAVRTFHPSRSGTGEMRTRSRGWAAGTCR